MEPNPSDTEHDEHRCRACGAVLWAGGTEEFMVGGTSGGWRLLFGEGSDTDEPTMRFELWICPSCRRLEFLVPSGRPTPGDATQGLRYACPGCGGDVYEGQRVCPSCGRPLSASG